MTAVVLAHVQCAPSIRRSERKASRSALAYVLRESKMLDRSEEEANSFPGEVLALLRAIVHEHGVKQA